MPTTFNHDSIPTPPPPQPAILTVISASTAVPTLVPYETSGKVLCISEDGKTIYQSRRKLISLYTKCSGNASGTGASKGGNTSDNTPSVATNAKVLHFITNAAQNEVVALKAAADGTLSDE